MKKSRHNYKQIAPTTNTEKYYVHIKIWQKMYSVL
jgi:uncharacterized membrane protein